MINLKKQNWYNTYFLINSKISIETYRNFFFSKWTEFYYYYYYLRFCKM